ESPRKWTRVMHRLRAETCKTVAHRLPSRRLVRGIHERDDAAKAVRRAPPWPGDREPALPPLGPDGARRSLAPEPAGRGGLRGAAGRRAPREALPRDPALRDRADRGGRDLRPARRARARRAEPRARPGPVPRRRDHDDVDALAGALPLDRRAAVVPL